MDWISKPVTQMRGVIDVPGDKSISHRALFFGAIARGNTLVNGLSNGEDCLRTFCIFNQLGVPITRVDEQSVFIHGIGKRGLSAPNGALDCGNSGTTMRLLMGLLVGQNFESYLIGDDSLQRRPMQRVSEPLYQMGAQIATTAGTPPVRIKPSTSLLSIDYTLPHASAQLKTALLFAGLYAKGTTRVTEMMPTRDHTERMFTSFGAALKKEGHTFSLDSSYEFKGTTIKVPGDFSSAAFFIVAATLIKDAQITIRQIGINPTRLGLIYILNEMGADITFSNEMHWGEEPVADIHVRYAPLKGIQIPAAWVPLAIDEFPVICIAAALAEGETYIAQASELRYKESDRLEAMRQGLITLGIEVIAREDGMAIIGGKLKGGVVSSYGDHRIAMAFAIAGSVAQESVKVLNCQAVSTSFPSFINCANQLQLSIRECYE